MLDNFIDGHWLTPFSGDSLGLGAGEGAHGGQVWVPRSDADDVHEALAAAAHAAPGWADLDGHERRGLLAAIPGLIQGGRLDPWIADLDARLGTSPPANPESTGVLRARLTAATARALARGWAAARATPPAATPNRNHDQPRAYATALTVPSGAPVDRALARTLEALDRGQTVVAAVLFGRARPADAWPLATLATTAACLPAGVLNLVCGLGLEVGLPLASAVRRGPSAHLPGPLVEGPWATLPAAATSGVAP